MRQLCSNANESYVVPNFRIDEVFALKDQKLIGWLGKIFDRQFAKGRKRICHLIDEDQVGIKHENGSYSHSLGKIQSGEAMLMFRGETPFIYEPNWLRMSTPFMNEAFVIIQDISTDIQKTEYFNLLNSFVLEPFIVIAIVWTFITLLLSYFWLKIFKNNIMELRYTYRTVWQKLIIFLKKIFIGVRLERRVLFDDFFTILFLYLFYTGIVILNNSIRAIDLVIDSSGVIKDEYDVFSTSRIACFVEDENEHQLAKTSPASFLFTRILKEKTKLNKPIKGLNNERIKDRCILEKRMENMNFEGHMAFALVGKTTGYSLLKMLTSLPVKKTVWISPKELYHLNYHFYFKNDPKYLYYENLIISNAEAGIFVNSEREIHRECFLSFVFSSNTLFTSLENYQKGNIKFESMRLENYECLFKAYFLFCLMVLGLFTIGELKRRRLKNQIRIGHL